jgi:spore germination protein D
VEVKRPFRFGTVALAVIVSCTTVVGCGSKGSQPQASTQSIDVEAKAQYNETKSMVLDILHTKEGLDTLKDIVRDPQFKQSLAINEADVQTAMVKAMTDGAGNATLMAQMRNPQFAATLAKAYKKDNEVILKDLMKDPEYQQMMLALLKSPDYQKTLYDLMKTPQYRKQTMDIMTQSLQNPQFKLMFLELVKEAIKQGAEGRTPNQKTQAGQTSTMETGGGQSGQGKTKESSSGGDQSSSNEQSSSDQSSSGDQSSTDDQSKKKKKDEGQ